MRNIMKLLTVLGGGGATYNARVLATSPTAYWKLDETTGTNAADSSGNGFNGTYSGPTLNGLTFTDGLPAPSFDGTNDAVDVFSAGFAAAFAAQQGTISMWIYSTEAGATLRRALQIGESDSTDTVYVETQTTHRGAIIATASREGVIAANTNTWRHVGITWQIDPDDFRVLFDGVSVAPNAGNTVGSIVPIFAYIGRRVDGRYWKGGIARVAYWNTVKSDAFLQALATA